MSASSDESRQAERVQLDVERRVEWGRLPSVPVGQRLLGDKCGQFGAGCHAEFREDVLEVGLHRRPAHQEALGDLRVGPTFGDQLGDLQLGRCQAGPAVTGPLTATPRSMLLRGSSRESSISSVAAPAVSCVGGIERSWSRPLTFRSNRNRHR